MDEDFQNSRISDPSPIDVDHLIANVILPKGVEMKYLYTRADLQNHSFMNLLSVTMKALPDELRNMIPSTIRSVKSWELYLQEENLEDRAEKLSTAIASLEPGTLLPVYLQPHSTALIISRPTDIPPDSILISWFETSIDPAIVNSTSKVYAVYPESLFEVPYSNLIKSKVFSEKLLNSSEWNGKGCGFVEWVTIVLMGGRTPAPCKSFNLISIRKTVRDETCSNSGFRRSGMWTTLKTTLHLALVLELGIELGQFVFKLIMVEILCQVARRCSLDLDVNSQTLAKLAKKIEKLRRFKVSQTQSPPTFQDIYFPIQNRILRKVQGWMSEKRRELSDVWNGIIDGTNSLRLVTRSMSSLSMESTESKYSTRSCERNTLDADYTFLKLYYFGKNRFSNMKKHVDEKKLKPGVIQNSSAPKGKCSKQAKSGKTKRKTTKKSKRRSNDPFGFEISVREIGKSWDPLLLRDQVIEYISIKGKSVGGDPIASSKLVLTALQSLRILDEIAVAAHPLLKEHKLLDFDIKEIISKLVVTTREESDLASSLHTYFELRNKEATFDTTLCNQIQASVESPSVRLASQTKWAELHRRKDQLLAEIKSNVAAKFEEIRLGREEYIQLLDQLNNTPCTCRNFKFHGKNHDTECGIGQVSTAMNRITVAPYIYPMPIKPESLMYAFLFELLLPTQVAALRDVVFLVRNILVPEIYQSIADSRDSATFQHKCAENHRQLVNTGRSKLFYLGRKKIGQKPVKIMAPDANFFISNVETRYTHSNAMKFSDLPQLTFQLKLGANMELQPFLDKWTHTHNQAMVYQIQPTSKLHNLEALEFMGLRAGHRLQYRNIYRAIASGTLSLQSEETFCLIAQAVWQIGPHSALDDKSIQGQVPEAHVDLANEGFAEEFLKILAKQLEENEGNWTATNLLLAIITIANKFFEFNLAVEDVAIDLLHKCRAQAWKWIKQIQICIQDKESHDEELNNNLMDVAICGALTYAASPDFCMILNTTTDALQWLRFVGTLCRVTKLQNYNTVLRGIHCKRVEDTGRAIASTLVDVLEQNPNKILNNFVKTQIGFVNHEWCKDVSEDHLYLAKLPDDTTYSVHILTGEFLTNGVSMSNLPLEITRHHDYQRIFGGAQFLVTTTDDKGEHIYTTKKMVNGRSYTFTLSSTSFTYYYPYTKSLKVTENQGKTVQELLPLELLKEDLPPMLVDGFSHWYSSKENLIRIRPQRYDHQQFETPKYNINLHSNTLTEVSTRNVIMDNIELATRILSQLAQFESPKFILIWTQSYDGHIIAKLPRFGLSFQWKNDGLASLEYNQMKLVSNSPLKTLIGLKKFLTLETDFDSGANIQIKKIIVPHGSIEFGVNENRLHRVVDINTDDKNLKNPPYFVYGINDVLMTLRPEQSTTAWLYLAALHGATTSPQIDPLTGLTGLEMAVQILQSGHCWSCKPFDESSISVLKFLLSMAPRRKLKPVSYYDKTVLQHVEAQSILSSYANFDGYYFLVKKLHEDSVKTSFLFPSSPVHDFDVDQGRDVNLARRGYWNYINSYNKAAWVGSEFSPEFTNSALQPVDFIPKCKYSFSENTSRLRLVASLCDKRTSIYSPSFPTRLHQMIYENPSYISGYREYISLSTHLGIQNIRDMWMQIYATALNSTQEEWTLTLCGLARNSNLKTADLLILHHIAVNASRFPAVPKISEFRSIRDTEFNAEAIKSIIVSCWAHSYRYGYSFDGNYNSPENCAAERESAISILVPKIQSVWDLTPMIAKDQRIQMVTEACEEHGRILHTYRTIPTIMEKFKMWEDNKELKLFVESVGQGLIATSLTKIPAQLHTWTLTEQELFKQLIPLALPSQPNLVKTSNFGCIDLEILEEFSIFSESGNGFGKTTPAFICRSKQELLNYIFGELEQISSTVDTLWRIVTNFWSLRHTEPHLYYGGLARRTNPAIIIRELLRDDVGVPKDLRTLIGALAVLRTDEQRARRILRLALDGSKTVFLDRELANVGHQNWEPMDHPEWLCLELELDATIRDIQVDVANHMLSPCGNSSTTQLNMGEGKTMIILPMLISAMTKSKEHCIRVLVLKSLYETNYHGLRHALGGMFNKRLHQFPCARGDQSKSNAHWNLTKDQVEAVLRIHEELKARMDFILTISEYHLSWHLRAYESAGKNIRLCQSLMDLMRWTYQNSRDILDESDEILNVKYQKVYAIGKSQAVDEVKWNVAQQVIKLIPPLLENLKHEYESCCEMAGGGNAKQDFPRCRLLNYTTESAECYANLVADLAGNLVDSEFPNLENKGLLTEFLSGEQFDSKQYKALCSILAAKEQEKVHTISELLSCPGVLQCALNKRWRVNFGVNPNGRHSLAVPFRAKDVAHEKTEFGHSLMSIILTQLSYYYSGLTDSQIMECFQVLEKHYENPEIEFDTWINTIPNGPPKVNYKSLNLKFADQMKPLLASLQKNTRLTDFWLSKVCFPKWLREYPHKIIASAWDLCYSQNRVVGFSGTNDTALLLPMYITQSDLPQLMATNENVSKSVQKYSEYRSLNSWTPTGVEILKLLCDLEIIVLIDAGALMTDLSNEEVAFQWLELHKYIDGVVYFSEANELTVKTRKKINCPFELSPLRDSLDQCAVYLDDEHTRGTDIHFPDGTTGCVTLGGRMTKEKLVQACMRLRLLQSGNHRVQFLASKEADFQIQSERTLQSTNLSPNGQDVINWVCHNSMECEKEGLVHWANSAVNFARKRGAVMNFERTRNFHDFAEQVQEQMVENKTDDANSLGSWKETLFVSHIPARFDAVSRSLVSEDTKVDPQVDELIRSIHKTVMDTCTQRIPSLKCFSRDLDEEQETEIEVEIETEVQVSRPPPQTPCTHKLDSAVINFVLHGILNKESSIAIKETRVKGLFASQDFLKVAQTLLRPVHWIASGTNPTVSNQAPIVVLLSPYEVNELIHVCKEQTPLSTVHMFSPRLHPGQDILINNPKLEVIRNVQGKAIITSQHLAMLHIYAGSLYFDPLSDEADCYRSLVLKLQRTDPGILSFIADNIKQRHRHFPETCDVYKMFRW